MVNVKGEVVPVHAMKAYRESSGLAPLVLNLCARSIVVNITLLQFYPQEVTPVPIE